MVFPTYCDVQPKACKQLMPLQEAGTALDVLSEWTPGVLCSHKRSCKHPLHCQHTREGPPCPCRTLSAAHQTRRAPSTFSTALRMAPTTLQVLGTMTTC